MKTTDTTVKLTHVDVFQCNFTSEIKATSAPLLLLLLLLYLLLLFLL